MPHQDQQPLFARPSASTPQTSIANTTAQPTIVTLPVPLHPSLFTSLQPPLQASVIHADASTTEFVLNCINAKGNCFAFRFPDESVSFTMAPSTLLFHYGTVWSKTGHTTQVFADASCTYPSAGSGDCYLSGTTWTDAGWAGWWRMNRTELGPSLTPVTITAGLEKLEPNRDTFWPTKSTPMSTTSRPHYPTSVSSSDLRPAPTTTVTSASFRLSPMGLLGLIAVTMVVLSV